MSANVIWTGAGGDSLYSNQNNWNTSTVPTSGDNAFFNFPTTVVLTGTGATLNNLDLANNVVFQLTSPSGANVLTVNGNLTFLGGATFSVCAQCTLSVKTWAIFQGAGSTVTFSNLGNVNFTPYFQAATTLANVPQGNNVIFNSGRTAIFGASITLPSSGFAFQNAAQTFATYGGLTTLTFNYRETVVGGWTSDNNNGLVSFVFNKGVNIQSNLGITNSLLPSPNCFFLETQTVTGNQAWTWECNPTFSGSNGVYFDATVANSQALVFNNRDPVFNTPIFGGNGIVQFNLNSAHTVTLSQALQLVDPNVVFQSQYTFQGGNAVNFNYTATLSNSWTVNVPFWFPKGVTFANTFANNGAGTFNIYDSLTASAGFTWTTTPVFWCSLPAKTVAIVGQMNFQGGINVQGCTVTSQNAMTVSFAVSTNGNTTLPAATVMSFANTAITFSGNAGNSITMPGDWTTVSPNSWTINNIELVLGGGLTLSTTSNVLGSGILTVNSNINFNSNNNLNVAYLGLNNKAYTFNSAGTIASTLILRNAQITGTATISYQGSTIIATKGTSSITNPNWQFINSITGQFQFDEIDPLVPAMVRIGGTTGQRLMRSSVTSADNFYFVFDDSVAFNTSSTVSGAGTNGGVQFMTSPTTVLNVNTVSMNGNIFLNSTDNVFNGVGTYNIASGTNVFLLGNWNRAAAGVSTNVVTLGSISFTLSANAVVGSSVFINSGMNTFDVDSVDTVASQTLTLEGNRKMSGTWTFGCNIVVGGSLTFGAGYTLTPPGSLTVQGNTITLESGSVTLSNQLVMANPTTIAGTSGNILFLNEAATTYPSHGLTFPATLTINTGLTVRLGNSVNNAFRVNGATSVNGFGTLQIYDGTVYSSAATSTIVLNNVYLQNSALTGAGPLTITTTTGFYLSSTVTALTPTTVSTNIVNAQNAVTLLGLNFVTNPVNFIGSSISFDDVRTVSVNYATNIALTFTDDVSVTSTGSFSGTGTLTFRTALSLASNLQISTNNVVFGIDNTKIVVISGANLVLSNQQTTVLGLVTSGGSTITSTSPSNYVHYLTGGNNGVIPAEWTWSNTIQLNRINVTGARVLTFPLMMSENTENVFNGGLTLNGNGAITYGSPTDTNNQVRVEGSFVTNTDTYIPNNVKLTVSGPSFSFSGSNVLRVNGSFVCETRVTFTTSVTFGYLTGTTPSTLTINPFCYFLGPSVPLTINRATIQMVDYSVAQNLYIENPITFGLLPNLFTTFDSSAVVRNTLLLKGDLTVQGNQLAFTGSRVYLNAITINTVMNSTLSNLNPNASITFSSPTTPSWVEPEVSFNGGLSQVVTLNGPIRSVALTVNSGAAIIGTGRIALVDSVTFPSSATPVQYSITAPVQLYVRNVATVFQFNLNNNYFTFFNAPSIFNPNGLPAPSFTFSGSGSLRTSYTGSTTIKDLTVTGGMTFRLSSGTFTAQTLIVQDSTTLWVDGGALVTTNLYFTGGNTPSVFQFTVSSATPTAVTSSYTNYQGSAVVNVVNFAWTGTAVTAISSTTANNGGLFTKLSGSPGYTFSQARSGASLSFSASVDPTITAFPTQSNGPSPAVSSSSVVILNLFVF